MRGTYTRRFQVLDSEGNGYIDRVAVEGRAQRLLKAMGEPADSPRAAAVRDGATAFWQGLAKLAGVQDGDRLDQEAFVAALSQAKELGTIGDLVGPSVEAHIGLVDRDGDGVVSLQEFLSSQNAFGLPEADSRRAFAALDLDGNGRLDVEEWQRAVVGFYTDPELDGPGALIMGMRG